MPAGELAATIDHPGEYVVVKPAATRERPHQPRETTVESRASGVLSGCHPVSG
ncbi:hypothetical protein OOK31_38755 [Streptomyces sp. NBC_00249]|uniref:hypothetical protein n=1 Tax=Streptomyces sp. NBC_00249 TaxID=2975690 RepID=UPI002251EFD2|nr:hypothetical protein [Streptomyces sp. NBC_00249]MCX5199754.1 hypothetical protein [Streptomyces sp. NBC_00249]